VSYASSASSARGRHHLRQQTSLCPPSLPLETRAGIRVSATLPPGTRCTAKFLLAQDAARMNQPSRPADKRHGGGRVDQDVPRGHRIVLCFSLEIAQIRLHEPNVIESLLLRSRTGYRHPPTSLPAISDTSPTPQPKSSTCMPPEIPASRRKRFVKGLMMDACSAKRRRSVSVCVMTSAREGPVTIAGL
jgi:hypothetical protein